MDSSSKLSSIEVHHEAYNILGIIFGTIFSVIVALVVIVTIVAILFCLCKKCESMIVKSCIFFQLICIKKKSAALDSFKVEIP